MGTPTESAPTGAQVIARSLRDLGVTVIFGLVGIPVVEIAEEAINLGIRFIAFRNEQACSYAASAYGYITGRPGVCLVVGGPGVLHAMAGIGNSTVNAFPLLVLAGSAESSNISKGAFQEMDAISFLTPHTKLALRPRSPDAVPDMVRNAYRTCWYGRPGATFVDLPADLIQGKASAGFKLPPPERLTIHAPPKPSGDSSVIFKATQLLKSAKAPLIVVGKGSAYARAESSVRQLVEKTGIPFLPTPMGKGVVPDSHPLNASSARSAALKNADVILVLGARLNWILHFGETPKWSSSAKIIQVDVSAEEIGRNAGNAELGIVGDINLVVEQILGSLSNWTYQPAPTSSFPSLLRESATKNEDLAQKKALKATAPNTPLSYQRAYHIIKTTLNSLSAPGDGGVVYVSEGANTMDISRSIFSVEHPRQRLDAGTYATMGVGLGYVIAAHAAYNLPSSQEAGDQKPKKIVAFEGDSAFGFSGMEIETLARYRMPALIFVINNSGIYHGDSPDEASWRILQDETTASQTKSDTAAAGPAGSTKDPSQKGLRSTTLLWETRYEQLATMCGGQGFFVRTEAELEDATRKGFLEDQTVTVVNVVVEPGIGQSIQFGWQASSQKESKL